MINICILKYTLLVHKLEWKYNAEKKNNMILLPVL